jgi:prephenate dehydrogenase
MFQSVAICGVGLIGGSFALALRQAGFSGEIIGVSSPATIEKATSLGVIHRGAPLEQALVEADLIYLAQPISAILDCLPRLDAARPEALITDAGSTKGAIVARAQRPNRRAQFLGGHPMAGKEITGVAAAEASLFRGRNYFVTPNSPAELETPAAIEFLDLLAKIGAVLRIASPADHDRTVAFTSHLPQLISTALAETISTEFGDKAEMGAGPGLLDMTRLAASSYDLWADILATNCNEVNISLDLYIAHLTKVRLNLQNGLKKEFTIASSFSKSLRNR